MVSVILIANDKQGNFTLSPLPVNQSLYEGVNTSAGLVMLYYNKHKLRNHLHWFNAKQTLIPANHSHHCLQLQRNSNQRLIALARQGIKDKFVTMSCLLNCEEFDSFEYHGSAEYACSFLLYPI